jgi:hypothetical protein
MSLNNKPTYGTVPAVVADSGTTKGSRRGVIVALAAAACFLLGVAAANVGPTQGLRGTALYYKDNSINVDNEGKVNNIKTGDVPAGSVIGLGPGVKPAPATPPVKPVPGVPGVPGVGGDGNVSPPTLPAPPATPATPTTGGPTQTDPWCCQTFGMCPTGYQRSGNVNANTVCCKDYSHGISINSDMPYCPTTPANDPFPNPNWTMGDGIGPITTPHEETGLGPIETGNPNGMDMGNMGMGMGMGGPGAIKTPSYKDEGY